MNTPSKVLKNSVYVLIARLAELLTGIITIALTTRYLGSETFGEYAFIGATTIALSPLIAMGCARILVRDVAVDGRRAGSLVVSAIWIHLVFTALALVITVGMLWSMQLRSPLALGAGLLAVAAQAMMALRQTVGSVPIAREAMHFEAWQVIASRLALVLLFAGVAAAGLPYPQFFTAALLAAGIGLVLAWIIMVRRFNTPIWGVRFPEIFYLLKESVPVAAYNFLGQLPLYLNVFLLKWLQDLKQMSYFQAPQRVIVPLMILPMSLLFAFSPAIARMGADPARFDDLRRYYRTSLRWVLILVFPCCVMATIYASALSRLLFGADFMPSAPSFGILIWGIVPFSLNALLNTILTAMGKQRGVVFTHVAALIVNAALGPWLCLRYGHCGASAAFLICVVCLFAFNHYYLRSFVPRLPLWTILWRPALAAAGFAFVLWHVNRAGAPVWAALPAFFCYAGLVLALRAVSAAELRDLFCATRGMLYSRKQL